jgi:site-specific DNA recombinase
MTRVCIYTRISTDEEDQPTSLHSQRERLTAFCKVQEDWRVTAHHSDRATGTRLDRSGLQTALELARAKAIDVLLVYRLDRLSRKVRQLSQLAEELDHPGVGLNSATEPFDTGSAAGRMMLQMLAVFAEFEHATIVDRITAGIERRAKQGHWSNGRVPFGYRRDEEKRLVPDERTVSTVRRIFHLYAEGRPGAAAWAGRGPDDTLQRRRAAGSRRWCFTSSRTRPTSGAFTGARRPSPVSMSRSSTRTPSPARGRCSQSAARTSPRDAPTRLTSCPRAWPAAGAVGAHTSG